VKNSVEGHVAFNAPTIYQGIGFDNVRLEFREGKIVNATANETEKLNKILDSDPGARYIGEFSLAFNPYILRPMRDILFDEKIAGSFHFTPGQAYEMPTTAIAARCIGTWSTSSGPITAAARSTSTASSSAATASSCRRNCAR
jgi:leucyl aminopeptidase (aminopeptidase T)